jgi:crotonobetainyl-CoA:carnitine CoA-transferase CaiB-like acyl-CoA transferase
MNGTDEQRDALGLSPASLAALNSRAILVQLDAWGGPMQGPKSAHLGYDDLAQAATGVMVRFGGGPDTPEEHAHFGTIDALTGYAACVALGAALERRRLTGKGGVARAALAGCGSMIQTQFMYDFDGRGPFDEPAGRDTRGWGPFYHCYRAADGWFFFAAPTEGNVALQSVPELADLVGVFEDVLKDALAQRFLARPISYWQAHFNQGSACVVPLGSLSANRDANLQLESDGAIDIRHATYRAIRHDRHPMGRWVDLVAPNAIRPERADITIPGPAPKPGAQTRKILSKIGLTEAEIGSMIDEGSASEGWSDKYLPE